MHTDRDTDRMTTTNGRHEIASQVLREVFEDEAIVLDMKSGNYFSLNQSGAMVWTLIEEGETVEGVIDRICEEYPLDARETITEGVRALIDRLTKEGLIGPSERAAPVASAPSKDSRTKNGRFEKPKLAVYDDMQDLLLLDPIHDVDKTGWPKRPDEAEG